MEALHSYGITPPEDLIRLQTQANKEAERQYAQSSLGSMTFDTAIGDAHGALVGLAADLMGTTERRSMRDMLLHEDRMRGLGVLCIGLALMGLMVDYIMVP